MVLSQDPAKPYLNKNKKILAKIRKDKNNLDKFEFMVYIYIERN
ncbi:MAG: hypothetical protein AAB296_01985 [Candidatus Desantisbacteria bacterium]